MTDAQFNVIKARLENSAITDVYMNAETWNDFWRIYWPGHGTPPPGRVRVWIQAKPRKQSEGMPYGDCGVGQPGTGYRAR
jgi:hypothetical protein